VPLDEAIGMIDVAGAALVAAAARNFASVAAICSPRHYGPVIAELRDAGSNLARPHVLEFYSYFPARADAERAAKALAGRGYKTSVEGPDDDEWELLATRESLVTEANVNALEVEVAQAAEQASGYYDGWETAVVE
jgi:hypothetical protein